MIPEDIYPVGLLRDIKHHSLVAGRRYLKYWIRERNWRAVRNYFNGYLAEHDLCHHDCGSGWTKRRASRSVNRICIKANAR